MVKIAHLIPLFPFFAFLINIAFGRLLKTASAIVSIAASTISLIFTLIIFKDAANGESVSYTLCKWLTINGVPINFGINVDNLSVMMLLVVTIVGTIIQVYSIGYMNNDPRYTRYFAYISLFMSSMLGLVIADNFLMLYIFWEGVGLCSYLLIAFWFERPAAARAGLKAFVVTRIGDTGFLLGIFILFLAGGTLYFSDLRNIVPAAGYEWMLPLAALLIFCGAIGKSAQFPLHVWLPDAMEGPTAVSALIHAATMVAAGVYLVARTYGLFIINSYCLEVVGVIGAISALMAASIATVNNDIKRVLAYSTISQLGLMMLGLGVGGYTAGTFHLMTHAFFKALLFLAAGSVIHSIHTQDIREMGALFPKMRITAITFIIGALALAGVPPFAGFWSKDEILSRAFNSGHNILFYMALVTSFLTAFYMARLIFLVFFGKARSDKNARESANIMTIPLMILAFFAVFAGMIGSPFTGHAFQGFVFFGELRDASEKLSSVFIMALSTGVSLLGIALAYLFYLREDKIIPDGVMAQLEVVYTFFLNKFYIDEIYTFIFVKPYTRICDFSFKFDVAIVDGAVNGAAGFVQWVSNVLRPIQTGLVQNYLLVQILGVLIFILTITGKLCFRF